MYSSALRMKNESSNGVKMNRCGASIEPVLFELAARSHYAGLGREDGEMKREGLGGGIGVQGLTPRHRLRHAEPSWFSNGHTTSF
jgi:hypothetical protein